MVLADWLGGFLFLAYIKVAYRCVYLYICACAFLCLRLGTVPKKNAKKYGATKPYNQYNHHHTVIIFYHARKRIKNRTLLNCGHQMEQKLLHLSAVSANAPQSIRAAIKTLTLAKQDHIILRTGRHGSFLHISAITCSPQCISILLILFQVYNIFCQYF